MLKNILHKRKLKSVNLNEENNSLNYCKLKFDMDIAEIRSKRLKRRMLNNQNMIRKL